MYATALFTHEVLELCKNKNLRYWFKATLTLETRISYICNTHGCERRNLRWSWNEAYITNKWVQQAGVPETVAKSVTPIVFACSSDTSLYSTKSWSRKVSWGSFVDLHWSISLAFIWNISLTWELRNWEGHCLRCPPMSTRLLATEFWLQVTDQRRHSWLSEVYVHTDSVIQINQHNFQQLWLFSLHRNLFTVSTDNFHYAYLFPDFMLGKRFQQQCNHEICTTTLFFMPKCRGGQKILCPSCPKVGGDMSPVPPYTRSLSLDIGQFSS